MAGNDCKGLDSVFLTACLQWRQRVVTSHPGRYLSVQQKVESSDRKRGLM
jgi:hypothetical protein